MRDQVGIGLTGAHDVAAGCRAERLARARLAGRLRRRQTREDAVADKFQAEHAMKEDYLPTGPRPDNQVRVANSLDRIATTSPRATRLRTGRPRRRPR